jgi:mediator of RNA polymerase II transcription subunit 13
MSSSPEASNTRPRDVTITRIGGFLELEIQGTNHLSLTYFLFDRAYCVLVYVFVIYYVHCLYRIEWQKTIYSFGGNEVKKWPVHLRRSIPDGIPSNSNGPTLQQQDMGLIQDRNMPSSPNTLYNPHSKSSFTKGQPGSKKQILVEQTGMDNSRGSLHLVRSISLVAVSEDNSLHLACQADLLARPAPGKYNLHHIILLLLYMHLQW